MKNLIEIQDLHFAYKRGKLSIPVFKAFDLQIQKGEFVAIQGQSGSGKSTLLYLIAGLLQFQRGCIFLKGYALDQMKDLELSLLRNKNLGFVFQQFHLIPQLTALENILLPTFYPIEERKPSQDFNKKAQKLACTLGIENRLQHKPNELSGGQQQRVAIARALIHDPDIILADEPTGHLDFQSTQQILEILQKLHAQGKSIVLITHERDIAQIASKVFTLQDGQLLGVKKASKQINKLSQEKSLKAYSKASWLSQILKLFPLSLMHAFQNKTRSFLTMLGIVVGVAALTSMVTLGRFTEEKILNSYADLGVNTFLFTGHVNWNLKATDWTPAYFESFDWKNEILYLKDIFSDIKLISPLMRSWGLSVIFSGQSIKDATVLMGISEDGLNILDWKLLAGVGINNYHVERRDSVCVIGFEIAQRLFLHISPIGQIIYLSKGDYNMIACKVIGILENRTSNKEWIKPNLQVYIPFTTFQMFSDDWSARIQEISIAVNPNSDIEKIGLVVKNFFQMKYGKTGYFSVNSDSVLLAQMQKFLNLFSILLTIIALASLLVGGIGIANMMLATVSERLRDIGVRKSIGATHLSIRRAFLLESVILCGLAGIIGVVVGICVYQSTIYIASLLMNNLEFEWVLDPLAILLSFVSIFIIGILSGLIPAIKAEKLQVIDALRI